MIVVMKRGASEDQVQHVVGRVEEFGLKAHVIFGRPPASDFTQEGCTSAG